MGEGFGVDEERGIDDVSINSDRSITNGEAIRVGGKREDEKAEDEEVEGGKRKDESEESV